MTRDAFLYHDRIIQDPTIMAGKPVVKGTRIPVERVRQHLADNSDLADLFQAFPQLTIEDVQASLAYACAHLVRGRRRLARRSEAKPSAG